MSHVAARGPRSRPWWPVVVGAVVFFTALVAGVGGACDLDIRPTLAQSDAFAFFRPELVAECCTCLAERGTAFPGASCEEGIPTDDGGVRVPGDAGISPDAPFVFDDGDDLVDDGEIPCLCEGNRDFCIDRLNENPDGGGAFVRVVGACVFQSATPAPCASECNGVLTFASGFN